MRSISGVYSQWSYGSRLSYKGSAEGEICAAPCQYGYILVLAAIVFLYVVCLIVVDFTRWLLTAGGCH